jgi:hypothetical protein
LSWGHQWAISRNQLPRTERGTTTRWGRGLRCSSVSVARREMLCRVLPAMSSGTRDGERDALQRLACGGREASARPAGVTARRRRGEAAARRGGCAALERALRCSGERLRPPSPPSSSVAAVHAHMSMRADQGTGVAGGHGRGGRAQACGGRARACGGRRTEPHLICQDAVVLVCMHLEQPVQALELRARSTRRAPRGHARHATRPDAVQPRLLLPSSRAPAGRARASGCACAAKCGRRAALERARQRARAW